MAGGHFDWQPGCVEGNEALRGILLMRGIQSLLVGYSIPPQAGGYIDAPVHWLGSQ
jgi:hypothetical protein